MPVPLDAAAMARPGLLVGHHDFSSFRSTSCRPVIDQTLDRFDVERAGEKIQIDVGARSFLHNQVRILVGTLQFVGRGQWSQRDVAEALAARDRTRRGSDGATRRACA